MDQLTKNFLRAGQKLADAVEDTLPLTVPGTVPVAELQEALRLYRREEPHVLNWRAVEATTVRPMAELSEKGKETHRPRRNSRFRRGRFSFSRAMNARQPSNILSRRVPSSGFARAQCG